MDLQGISFCVENKKKFVINPFRVMSSLEPHDYHTIHFSGRNVAEHSFSSDIGTKGFSSKDLSPSEVPYSLKEHYSPKQETCHSNDFASIMLPKFIGGFVGSKSQMGFAKKEAYKIWDIILKKFTVSSKSVTNCHSVAQQRYNFNGTFSQGLFNSFYNKTAFDIASYFISQDCNLHQQCDIVTVHEQCTFNKMADMVTDETRTENMKSIQMQLPSLKKEAVLSQCGLTDSVPQSLLQKCDMSSIKVEKLSKKQSYAEVARACTPKLVQSPADCQKQAVNTTNFTEEMMGTQSSGKNTEQNNWRVKIETVSSQERVPNTLCSGTQYKKFNQNPQKFRRQEQVSGRYRGTVQQNTHRYVQNKYFGQTDSYKKPVARYGKRVLNFDNRRYSVPKPSTLEPEPAEYINHIASKGFYCCNQKSAQMCKNWRCKHNRITYFDHDLSPAVTANSSILLEASVVCQRNTQRDDCMTCNGKNNMSNIITAPSKEYLLNESGSPASAEVVQSLDHNDNGISSVSTILVNNQINACSEETSHTEDFDSLVSAKELAMKKENSSVTPFLSASSCSITSNISKPRHRFSSECSVDSEDSFIVQFECDYSGDTNKECNVRTQFHCSFDSDTSDCWSEIDGSDSDTSDESDVDDDVDFCYITTASVIPGKDGHIEEHLIFPLSLSLKEVNEKWKKENLSLPSTEKYPEKVHFAVDDSLATVHRMVKWDFAYRAARSGPWEQMARDRARFRSRIDCLEAVLAPVLDPKHRRRIQQRMMISETT